MCSICSPEGLESVIYVLQGGMSPAKSIFTLLGSGVGEGQRWRGLKTLDVGPWLFEAPPVKVVLQPASDRHGYPLKKVGPPLKCENNSSGGQVVPQGVSGRQPGHSHTSASCPQLCAQHPVFGLSLLIRKAASGLLCVPPHARLCGGRGLKHWP